MDRLLVLVSFIYHLARCDHSISEMLHNDNNFGRSDIRFTMA